MTARTTIMNGKSPSTQAIIPKVLAVPFPVCLRYSLPRIIATIESGQMKKPKIPAQSGFLIGRADEKVA